MKIKELTKYNIPETFKCDYPSLNYAVRNQVPFIFVDQKDGRIWQYSRQAFTQHRMAYLKEHFQHMANCISMSTLDYIKLFGGK